MTSVLRLLWLVVQNVLDPRPDFRGELVSVVEAGQVFHQLGFLARAEQDLAQGACAALLRAKPDADVSELDDRFAAGCCVRGT